MPNKVRILVVTRSGAVHRHGRNAGDYVQQMSGRFWNSSTTRHITPLWKRCEAVYREMKAAGLNPGSKLLVLREKRRMKQSLSAYKRALQGAGISRPTPTIAQTQAATRRVSNLRLRTADQTEETLRALETPSAAPPTPNQMFRFGTPPTTVSGSWVERAYAPPQPTSAPAPEPFWDTLDTIVGNGI